MRKKHKHICKRSRKTRTYSNKHVFPKQEVSKLNLSNTAVTFIFTYFLFKLEKQNKTGSILNSYKSRDKNAEDMIHTDTDITTCNTEEPRKKSRLVTCFTVAKPRLMLH